MVGRVKGVRGGPAVSLFDIRIGTNSKDVIVITPSEIESSPTLVRGRVVLSLNDSLSVKNITLRMYGVATVAWVDSNASNRTPPTRASQRQTKTVYEKEWSFLPQAQSTFTLKQGNYEYPFETLLPDNIPDSVEGLPGGAIIYKMKAIIERTGLVNKNVVCRKHIRIVRTMSPTSFEFLQSQSIENLWPNKCQYTIEIPTTAHIIGSQIPFHIYMIPHVKGLNICRLDIELKEHYVFAVLDSKNALIAEKKNERTIKSVMCDQRPEEEDEWNIHGYIEIPNSLDRCTQDCDANFIKVKHRVKFVIGLRNADGHVSEIRASLPAALVLPPYINSSGTTPHLEDSTVNHLSYLEANGDSLPSYESRIYDRLWDGVSYGGLDTSALNTPINLSRRASAENLRDFSQVSMPNPGDLEAGLRQALREREASPADPHSHSSENLSSLATSTGTGLSAPPMRSQLSQQSVHMAMTPLHADDEPPRLSPTSSPEMQHISPTISNSSQETPPPEPPIDMGRLSRVPSYNTANASNILNLDPITNALPTYATATSLPSIPESRSRANSQTNERPGTQRGVSTGDVSAGVRNAGGVGSVYGSPQTFDDPMRRIHMMRHLFSSR